MKFFIDVDHKKQYPRQMLINLFAAVDKNFMTKVKPLAYEARCKTNRTSIPNTVSFPETLVNNILT